MDIPSRKVIELAKDVERALNEYSKAIWEYQHIKEKLVEDLADRAEKLYRVRIDKEKLENFSSDINAAEFWAEVVISKISIIEIIGGQNLLNEVHGYLTDIYRSDFKEFSTFI